MNRICLIIHSMREIKLYKQYENFFNLGVALSDFFLMDNNELYSYFDNISKYLSQLKQKDLEIPDIEKIKKDTIEVLNYAKTQILEN